MVLNFFQRNRTILILFLILAVAGFFRLWHLDSIPPGLYPDEAINGNEAISNPGKIFYPENNGREGLFINLIFLSFSIFGVSIWSIKIVSAIIGILTVLGLYLLTKELFKKINNQPLKINSKVVALLSSFFLAISFWHTNFSRIGFRGILVPFILVFAFYFLFRAFRKKNLSDFIISGIFWGLGFYTYIPFRIALLILIIFLILKLIDYFKKNPVQKNWRWLLNKMYLQNGWWKIDLFLLIIILIAIPLGIYFLQNPEYFISRIAKVSIFAQDSNPPFSQFAAFGKSLILHLAMFNFYGDPNWRHNFAGSPQLFWPVGILFLIGFFFVFSKLTKCFVHWSTEVFAIFGFLIVWFFFMLLPGILTYEGIPHSLRTIGVIPVVYIFAGLGGWWVYQYLNKIIVAKKLLIVLCALFFVVITYGQFCKYFLNWANLPEVEDAFSKDYVDMGNYLNSLSPETQKYVIVNQSGVPVPYPDGIPMPAQTIMFIERTKFGKPRATYLLPENLTQIEPKKETVILTMKCDKELFKELSQRFPQGKFKKENRILIYEIR
ncbi:MAG: glycosyltransferase family 39 protein [Patescibacteria group bacterium]|nr:glycosyltransferase family 39 protein [Patescibacteria group bacterium]